MSNYVEARRRPFGGDARDERARVAVAGNPAEGLERAAYYALLAFVALLPFSIFASELLLTVTGVLWLALIVRGHEKFEVPGMFWRPRPAGPRSARSVSRLAGNRKS